METACEASDINSVFTRLIAQEDFLAYNHSESFKSFKNSIIEEVF
jgi:hypothetical protein